MAEEKKTDYLRFSAYSIKELINRKLAQDTNFTDQIYEGSNLAVLIDIVSYMYQCLVYQLNNAASESMFSDTQIYENIVRLCKFIGYTPKGAQSSVMSFSSSANVSADIQIQQYSYIQTQIADGEGENIAYSAVDKIMLKKGQVNNILLHNGKWERLAGEFKTSGATNETFQLTQLDKDQVSWPYVDVYLEKANNGGLELCRRVVGSTFFKTQQGSVDIYKAYDTSDDQYAYRLTIDEDGKYGLEFGIGKPLPPNRNLRIYYLRMNQGITAETIEPGDITDATFTSFIDNATQDMVKLIIGDSSEYLKEITFINTSPSSKSSPSETSDEIRHNAPMVNKLQSRLVTRWDYQNFVKYMNSSNIIDVVAQNNYEYMNTFYKWLYMIGQERHGNPRYYIDEDRLQKYDYRFSDAADQNTVYLWIKTFSDSDIYFNTINDQIDKLKMITTDVCYLKPIDVNFSICGADDETTREMIRENGELDENSYIEVTLNENCIYSSSQLKGLIYSKIVQFFDESKQKVGGKMAIGDLTNEIYAIGGIQQLKTVYSTRNKSFTRYGLNFACWSVQMLDSGDDLFFVNGDKTLEPFQFPMLNQYSIRIKIIKRYNQNILESINY